MLIRHDAAHVMAEAVQELYPGAKVTIGPAIENGFYYDFDFPSDVKVTDADLEKIEAAMRAHVEADEAFERRDVPVVEAIEIFEGQNEDYKVELINDLIEKEGVRPSRSTATVLSRISAVARTVPRPGGSRRSS